MNRLNLMLSIAMLTAQVEITFAQSPMQEQVLSSTENIHGDVVNAIRIEAQDEVAGIQMQGQVLSSTENIHGDAVYTVRIEAQEEASEAQDQEDSYTNRISAKARTIFNKLSQFVVRHKKPVVISAAIAVAATLTYYLKDVVGIYLPTLGTKVVATDKKEDQGNPFSNDTVNNKEVSQPNVPTVENPKEPTALEAFNNGLANIKAAAKTVKEKTKSNTLAILDAVSASLPEITEITQ